MCVVVRCSVAFVEGFEQQCNMVPVTATHPVLWLVLRPSRGGRPASEERARCGFAVQYSGCCPGKCTLGEDGRWHRDRHVVPAVCVARRGAANAAEEGGVQARLSCVLSQGEAGRVRGAEMVVLPAQRLALLSHPQCRSRTGTGLERPGHPEGRGVMPGGGGGEAPAAETSPRDTRQQRLFMAFKMEAGAMEMACVGA